ncbi:MAG: HAD-IIIA family hydrolase [Candidatus Omnitrophica bacterium]|nr:HAD-IIIA family hydrolase [Candidatus Omnitrophota bacterium]
MTPDISERAKKVKLLILDIDGVMTDGRLVYSIYGDELKFFDVTDGFGITLLRRAGIKTAIISAKRSRIVKMRVKHLKIDYIYQGFHDKLTALNKVLRKTRLTVDNVCFIGDDLIDLPVLKRAGFAVAVPNAVDEVKERAHHVTSKTGGRGAVREICELILKSQGKWDAVTSKYFV